MSYRKCLKKLATWHWINKFAKEGKIFLGIAILSVSPLLMAEEFRYPVIIGSSGHELGYLYFRDNNRPKLYIQNSNPLNWISKSMNLSERGEKVLVTLGRQYHDGYFNGFYKVPLIDISTSAESDDGWLQIGKPTNKVRATRQEDGTYNLEFQISIKSLSHETHLNQTYFSPRLQLRWVNIDDISDPFKFVPDIIRPYADTNLQGTMRAIFKFESGKPIPSIIIAHDLDGYSYFIPEQIVSYPKNRDVPIMRVKSEFFVFPESPAMYDALLLPITDKYADFLNRLFFDSLSFLKVTSFSVSSSSSLEQVVAEAKDILKRKGPEMRKQGPGCPTILFRVF